MSNRTVAWAAVETGDVVLGADSRPWHVERQPYDDAVIGMVRVGAPTGSAAPIYGRPDQAADVVVIRRGETGRAVDLLRTQLGAEIVTREESK